MRIPYVIALAMLVTLSGCATQYVPQGEWGGIEHGGYDDVRVNGHTAIIKFQGNSRTSPQTIHAYMLRRSAEVTMENGYQYFTILSTSSSPININVTTSSTTYPIYPPSSSGFNFYTPYLAGSSTEEMTRTPFCQQQACQSRSVTAVINMFSNSSGARAPRSYNVYDVIGHQ